MTEIIKLIQQWSDLQPVIFLQSCRHIKGFQFCGDPPRLKLHSFWSGISFLVDLIYDCSLIQLLITLLFHFLCSVTELGLQFMMMRVLMFRLNNFAQRKSTLISSGVVLLQDPCKDCWAIVFFNNRSSYFQRRRRVFFFSRKS